MIRKKRLMLITAMAGSLLLAGTSNAGEFITEADDESGFRDTHVITRTANALQNGQLNVLDSGIVGQQAKLWLDHVGTTQLDLHIDEHFSFKESALDILLPLAASEHYTFTQLGIRRHDRRTTMNVGGGQRYLSGGWMLGYNAFYDVSWQNTRQRWGVGLEAWRDYLKLSANGYRAISGWHASSQHADYEERPADGWDLRGQTWLPAYPQLGIQLMYEQYYGDNVALHRFSTRKKNPHALSTGVSYTPVPLVTTGVDVSNDDVRYTLGLVWRIGEPWHKQIDPDAVAGMLDLSGSRLDLVNRNNNIVFDYRKKQMLTMTFPARIEGVALAEYTFIPVITSRHAISHLEMDDAELRQGGGQVVSASKEAVTLRLPARTGAVTLRGTAVDMKGGRSNVAKALIATVANNSGVIVVDKKQAIANGNDKVVVTVTLRDAQGNPKPGEKISWSTTLGALSETQGLTTASGEVSVVLTSSEAGQARVTAATSDQQWRTSPVSFVENVNHFRITADKTTALGSGFDPVTFTLTARQADGSPISGETVVWESNLGTLAGMTSVTDENGNAMVSLSSFDEGLAQVTARIAGQRVSAPLVRFSEYLLLYVQYFGDTLHGVPLELYLMATDSRRRPLAHEEVVWSASRGVLSEYSSSTDSDGVSSVHLTVPEPGSVHVIATVKGHPSDAAIMVH